MSCEIDDFRKKYSIPENTKEVALDKMSPQQVAEMKVFANLTNREAALEGFDRPLISLENTGISEQASETLVFNTQNIAEFDSYIEAVKESNEMDKRISLQELEDSIYEDSEGEPHIVSDNVANQEGELLYSPIVVDDDSFMDDPTNHYEWRASLLKVQKDLKTLAVRHSKLGNREQQREVNNTIEDIQKNLDKLDENDPFSIYESSVAEVELLHDFLLEIDKDPSFGAEAVESNQLYQRIGNLEQYFLGRDPRTGNRKTFKELDHDKNPTAEFYFDFMQKLDEDRAKELKAKVNDLVDLFDNTKVTIIEGLLTNDFMVQDFLNREEGKDGSWSQEDLETVLEFIREGDVDIHYANKLFLGASGAGIVGNILRNSRDRHLYSERGVIQERVTRLENAWKEIKDVKAEVTDSNGKKRKINVVETLFKRDKFGKRTRNLLGKYSDHYNMRQADTKAERGAFYNNRNSSNYASWMRSEKNYSQRINPMALSSIAEAYKNHPEVGKYFNMSPEDIRAYERELRDTLGDTMFEIEAKKAKKLIDDFVAAQREGLMTVEQEYRRNPFKFIEHYNSENFDKRDEFSNDFLEPTYTLAVPLNEGVNFNEDFASVEEGEHGENLMKFYTDAHSLLTEYIHPILQSEGVPLETLEMMVFEDLMERETLKSKGFFGKVTHSLKALWDSYSNMYFDKAIARQRETIEKLAEDGGKRKLQVGYVGHAKREFKILVEAHKNLPPAMLVKEAEKRGYDTSKFATPGDFGYKTFIESLAESLAADTVNETTSTNLFETIKNASNLAADISARRASVAVVEALKLYLSNIQGQDPTGLSKVSNISSFLDSWADANIYKYKYSQDMDDKTSLGSAGAISRRKVGLKGSSIKKLSREEKKIKKFFKAELKNKNNGRDQFNFTYKNKESGDKVEVTTKELRDGSFRYYLSTNEETLQPISMGKVLELNGEYLEQRISELGVDMTIGSAALGIMTAKILSQLGLSPRTGSRNRFQGIIQNLSVAASQRYGFSVEQYNLSRRLLRGTNIRKYFASSNFRGTKRGKTIETVKMFQSAMQLSQNKADVLALEGKFEGVASSLASKVKTFWMDFSMNNPEWHNQTEVMLSILQTVMVRDKHGNEHPFFNGETQETIYKEGTLELKDAFNTDENNEMWVRFRSSKEGKQDSLVALHRIKTAIHQTQGNYDNTDLILIQNSVPGKIITMYQRYLYENTDLQWGKNKVDLRSGLFEVKGRKRVLAEHAPTTAVYLAGAMGTRIASGVALAATTLPIAGLLAAAGGVAATAIGFHRYHKHVEKKSKASRDEVLLAVDFAKEVALRAINTPVSFITYGKHTALDKHIDGAVTKEKAEKRNLTLKERQILSESAQEIVSKFYTASFYNMLMVGVKASWLMLSATAYEDLDEDDLEEKLKEFDKVMNALSNDKKNAGDEIMKFTNPAVFQDEATAFSFFREATRFTRFVYVDTPDYFSYESDVTPKEYAYKAVTSLPGLLMPSQLSKSLLSEDKGMFKDNRVYGTKDPVQEFIKSAEIVTDGTAKAEATSQRQKIKRMVDRNNRRRLIKENPNASTKEIDKMISDIYTDIVKGTYKTHPNNKYRSYKTIYEKTDWKKLQKEAKEGK